MNYKIFLRTVHKVRLRYKKTNIKTNRTATTLHSYFHHTFIVPIPYLFRIIYYSDK